MKRIKYKEGEKVGDCVYLRDVKSIGNRRALFKCVHCDDGKTFVAFICDVKSGHTTSCGCQSSRLKKTHGLYRSQIYTTWSDMVQRCTNPRNQSYFKYGGRNIFVFDEWRCDFKSYYNYVMSLPNAMKKGYTIDRINNNGNYEPGNLRWVDRHTQQANQNARSDCISGYRGIYMRKRKWVAQLQYYGLKFTIGSYFDKAEAVWARNNFIIENKLWEYPLQTYNK